MSIDTSEFTMEKNHMSVQVVGSPSVRVLNSSNIREFILEKSVINSDFGKSFISKSNVNKYQRVHTR